MLYHDYHHIYLTENTTVAGNKCYFTVYTSNNANKFCLLNITDLDKNFMCNSMIKIILFTPFQYLL